MFIRRTRFKKKIITEFMAPRRTNSRKVMIFCGGVPGVPHKDEALDFWARQGFWTFFPRYRGTWESKGEFLKTSPEKVVFDVLENLKEGFTDIWSGRKFKCNPGHVTVVGSSFGGPAALLSSLDERIDRCICISPVVDWREEDKFDPLDNLYSILNKGYGAAYRVKKSNWNKLKGGEFYNPAHHLEKFNGEKILIFHALNDDIVPFKPVEKFAEDTGATLVTFKKGGHLSSTLLMHTKHTKRVHKFLKA